MTHDDDDSSNEPDVEWEKKLKPFFPIGCQTNYKQVSIPKSKLSQAIKI